MSIRWGCRAAARVVCASGVLWVAGIGALDAAAIVTGPLEWSVHQRDARNKAWVPVSGTSLAGSVAEARAVPRDDSGIATEWQAIATAADGTFDGGLPVLRGWYDIEVRSTLDPDTATIERVGVGEMFVIAGQSNAGSHGSPKQTPDDERVTAHALDFPPPFPPYRDNWAETGEWAFATDPQPISTGWGGQSMAGIGRPARRTLRRADRVHRHGCGQHQGRAVG